MKKTLVILFTIAISASAFGQYYQDALRFSTVNTNFGTSARMRALGGAGVALGADLSSAIINPAGLGMYNRSDVFFTPSLNFINSKNTYLGQTDRSFKNNFNMANIGIGLNFNKGEYSTEKFKGGTVALTISRVNDFQLMRAYSGVNKHNSLAKSIVESKESASSGIKRGAIERNLIFPNKGSYDATSNGTPTQGEAIRERGSTYRYSLAWGGNYDDIFYFGGGIGYYHGTYRAVKNYEETNFKLANGSVDPKINSVLLDENLKVRQNGFDFNFGVTVRPVEFLTLGASYTTPTFNTLRDSSYFDLGVNWKNGATLNDTIKLNTIKAYQSPITTAKYQLRTPGRLRAGAGLFLGKYGFLSGDVEFVDYKSALVQSNDFSSNKDNSEILNRFQNVINMRFGAEIRVEDFRLRGGYAFMPNPIKNAAFKGEQIISGGIGYRPDDFYVDFTVSHSSNQKSYSPYAISTNQPVVNSAISQLAFTATVGFTFE